MSLVPEKRADKNGRLVTRHVRSSGTSVKKTLPQPALTTVSRDTLVQELIDTLDIRLANRKSVEDGLAKYSDALISRLHKARIDDRVDRLTMSLFLSDEPPENSLSQVVGLISLTTPKGSGFRGYSSLPIINGLHRYKSLPPSHDYALESKVVRDQCAAIVKVVNVLIDHVNPELGAVESTGDTPLDEQWATDERLVEMLVNDPRLASKVIDVIKETGRGDFPFISAYLRGDSTALVDGEL
jgi:hypothetical protein